MRRLAVILLLVFFLVVAGAAAIFQSPRIEARLGDIVTSAIGASPVKHDVSATIDGRFVALTGSVQSLADKAELLTAVDAVRGHLDINAEQIVVLPLAAPFRFSVDKASDGKVTIEGFAPDEASRQYMLRRAQDLFGTDNVNAQIKLASGVPDADWSNMADRGMEAVSQLIEGQAELSDQQLFITGTAETFEFAKRVETTVKRDRPDQYKDKGRLDIGWLPPMIEPYRLEITKGADGIRLAGAVPNDDVAAALVARIKADHPDIPVEVQLITGRGMPTATWPSDVATVVSRLPELARGRFVFNDTLVLVEGQTKSDEQRRTIASAVEGLAGYQVRGRLDLETPVVEQAPDGQAQPTVAPVAEDGDNTSENTPTPVNPDSSTSGDAPENTEAAAGAGTGEQGGEEALLASFDPELWFDGSNADVNGFALPNLVSAPSQAACDRWFAWRQRRDRINFASGSAEISEENKTLLNEIASVLSACLVVDGNADGKLVRVVGHTDSTGSADANKALSAQRAASVVQALVDRGIDTSNLTAVGMGGEIPVASNETEEGRAENRRIEFDIKSVN